MRLAFRVNKGANQITAGIGAVRARIQTGCLKVVIPACPNLLAEAKLYAYGPQLPGQPKSELPVDRHNHALGALRYLISRLDASV
jgi:hypothetical protein